MKPLFAAILLLFAATGHAAQKAITDLGEEVILNSDGTWEYSDSGYKADQEISTNTEVFTKPDTSSFLLKSTINDSAYWINTDKWSFNKANLNDDAEYEFESRVKGQDIYGLVITEEIEVELESLAKIAFDSMQEAAADAKLVQQEYRMVNGKKVIFLEISASVEGLKLTYFGYYYSNTTGSTQLLFYTSTNLGDKYRSEIHEVLNGLTTQ